VIEHGDTLGDTNRMVGDRVEREDARADMDALGLRERVGDERLAGREVRVLGQRVVLGAPHVLPVVPVGFADELELVDHGPVFGDRVVCLRTRQEHLHEDPELHGSPRFPLHACCTIATSRSK
jgi:hypothetical protein